MDQGKRDIARYNDFKDREAILGDYYETSGVWETMSQGFSLPSLDDTIADDYEHWLKTHPVHFRTLSKRATLVLPYLIEEIQRREYPMELALIPIIESSLNTHATSPSRAAGLWQIIPSTGEWLGPSINSVIDERRNIIQSTQTSLDYLKHLTDYYDGNWALGITSYNAGNGNVDKALKKSGQTSEFAQPSKLPLKNESRAYYSKLIGLRNYIVKSGSLYPSLPDVSMDEFFTADRAAPGQTFSSLAREFNTDVEIISFLNADFLGKRTLKNRTTVLVPKNYRISTTAEQFAIEDLKLEPITHRINSGESLGVIAQKYNTTVNTLKRYNNLSSNLIRAGQSLLIPIYN